MTHRDAAASMKLQHLCVCPTFVQVPGCPRCSGTLKHEIGLLPAETGMG